MVNPQAPQTPAPDPANPQQPGEDPARPVPDHAHPELDPNEAVEREEEERRGEEQRP